MNFSKLQRPRNRQKVTAEFFRKYGYYFVLGLALLSIVLAVVIANAAGSRKPGIDVPANTDALAWSLPVERVEIIKPYSDKELQKNITTKLWEIHKGIDFKLEATDGVFAVLDGTVLSVKTTTTYGTVVVIEHADGFKSSYGSLAKTVNVKAGDKITAGTKIGTASTSAGNESAQGIHLHFELIKDEKQVDPMLYLDFGEDK